MKCRPCPSADTLCSSTLSCRMMSARRVFSQGGSPRDSRNWLPIVKIVVFHASGIMGNSMLRRKWRSLVIGVLMAMSSNVCRNLSGCLKLGLAVKLSNLSGSMKRLSLPVYTFRTPSGKSDSKFQVLAATLIAVPKHWTSVWTSYVLAFCILSRGVTPVCSQKSTNISKRVQFCLSSQAKLLK